MLIFKCKSSLLALLSLIAVSTISAQTNDLTKGWDAFNQNSWKDALSYFQSATQNPATSAMAYLDMSLVDENSHNPAEGFQNFMKFYQTAKNPYPYIYALWSYNFINTGSLGNGDKDQLGFFKELADDPKANITLKAMANEAIGDHYLLANDYVKSWEAYNKIGAIDKWSITGVFDNISGSGFNKDFGPLEHPQADAIFKNSVGANIHWFEVKHFRNDRWFDFAYNFDIDNSIMYAQSFVNSPIEREAVLMTGVSGSLKIWVNDKLITKVEEERNTDLDVYKNTIHLNKGYNRVLVQIGASKNTKANFMVRLADLKGNLLQNLSYSAIYQPYAKAGNYETISLPLFAEQYFKEQLKDNPKSLVNKFLLASTYIRNQKALKARQTMSDIRSLAPKSAYASMELIRAYGIEDNKTNITKEQEYLKKTDPDNYMSLSLLWSEAIKKEDYAGADKYYQKIVTLYGNDLSAALFKLTIEIDKKDMGALEKDLKDYYTQYPNNYFLTSAKYSMDLNDSKDLKAANEVLKKYLENHDNANFRQIVINNYFKLGNRVAAEKMMNHSAENLPYSTGDFGDYAKIYFGLQDYKTALLWEQKAVNNAPYIGNYYNSIGNIYDATKDKNNAVKAYKQCVYYDPTNYDVRKKLRELENTTDAFANIQQLNLEDIYDHAPDSSKYPNDNSIILLNDKQRVVYNQGASEERVIVMAKIFNQAGIDDWKECNIDYNSYTQRIIVERAEVLKKDGSKVKAETNGGDIVFTSLETGDAIVYVYRLENFNTGRLANHFWDNFHFNFYVPVQLSRYSIAIPDSETIYYKTINEDLKPTIESHDGQKIYTWQARNVAAIENENYMPAFSDIGHRLEVSSIPNWKYIQDWYSDLSSTKAKVDFDIMETVKELFKGKENLTQLQKVKIIYDYIIKHINYSDVSFLHSAFTPQLASRTLNTRLGDCKDLSTLFVAMAKEVGVKANLVLVDTRDNGNQDLLLPGIGFNHCIANVEADGKDYLLELTNPYLPFGALTYYTREAIGLYIPRNDSESTKGFMRLTSATDLPETITRTTDISMKGNDLLIKRHNVFSGSLSAGMRESYATLGKDDQLKRMTNSVAKDFKTNIVIDSLSFYNLYNLDDSAAYSFRIQVTDAVNEIAGMSILKLPWTDSFNSLDFLTQGKRSFAFELWKFGLGKQLKERIVLEIPKDKKLAETPKDISYNCGAITYSIKYKITPQALIATREMDVNKDTIAIKDYDAFKDFFSKVSKADNKQYAIK